jgi:5-methylcytosine-specific restriction endonuclease McrA
MLVRAAGVTRRVATKRRRTRGYAESRRAYDSRRRGAPLNHLGRQFKAIVQCDPCPFCDGSHAQIAADHIVPLDAGGENAWTNLAGVCRRCNASKKNEPLLRWMLRRICV